MMTTLLKKFRNSVAVFVVAGIAAPQFASAHGGMGSMGGRSMGSMGASHPSFAPRFVQQKVNSLPTTKLTNNNFATNKFSSQLKNKVLNPTQTSSSSVLSKFGNKVMQINPTNTSTSPITKINTSALGNVLNNPVKIGGLGTGSSGTSGPTKVGIGAVGNVLNNPVKIGGLGTGGSGTGTGGTGTGGTGTGGTGTGTGGTAGTGGSGSGMGSGSGGSMPMPGSNCPSNNCGWPYGGFGGFGLPFGVFSGYGGYGGGYGGGAVYADPGVAAVAPAVSTVAASVPADAVATGSVDLVLEDIHTVSPATLVAGPAYRVTFRNQGTLAAGPFRVAIVAAVDGKPSEQDRAIVSVPSLMAGASTEVTLRLPASAMKIVNVSTSQPSAFSHLIVAVDPDNSVVETDKANNVAVVERTALEAQ
jgi:hypothetical protein